MSAITGGGALAAATGFIAVSTFKSGQDYVESQYVPGTRKLDMDDKVKASNQAFAQTGLAGLVALMGGVTAILATNEAGKVGRVGAGVGIGCAPIGVAAISNSMGIGTAIQ